MDKLKSMFNDDAMVVVKTQEEFVSAVQQYLSMSDWKEAETHSSLFTSLEGGIFGQQNAEKVLFYKDDGSITEEDILYALDQRENFGYSEVGTKDSFLLFSEEGERAFVDKMGAFSRGFNRLPFNQKELQVKQNGLAIAQNIWLRISYGKIRGVLSSEYVKLNQNTLVQKILEHFDKKHYNTKFVEGSVGHDFTVGEWKMDSDYATLFDFLGDDVEARITFKTNDIGDNAATITTSLVCDVNGNRVKMVLGDVVKVNHIGKNVGINTFADGLEEMFAATADYAKNLEKLNDKIVANPEHCVWNLATKAKISRRVKEEISYMITITSPRPTRLDVYRQLSAAIQMMDVNEVAPGTIIRAQESIAKLLSPSFDWAEFDTHIRFE